MILETFRAARDAGRLGLVVYAMPGYPDPAAFEEIARVIEASELVSAVETTLPGARDLGVHEALRAAHQAARAARRVKRPNVAVVYPDQLAAGWEVVLDALSPDAVSFEGADDGGGRAACRGREIEWIESATPWMSAAALGALRAPLVYLSCAGAAGEGLARLEGIARAAAELGDRVVVAGMGIKGAEDVARLAAIPEIGGVVIGSAFVRAMAGGAEEVRAFLSTLAPSLRRR